MRGLLAEAERFDGLASQARRAALIRLAGHLAALIEVPSEVAEAARLGTVRATEAPPRSSIQTVSPAASTTATATAPPTSTATAPRPAPPPPPWGPAITLDTPLDELPGVHASPRALLEERGRLTAGQALEFWPRTWQDRTRLSRIAGLPVGQEGIILATVQAVRQKRMRNGRAMLEVSVTDGTSPLSLVFFNAPPWKEKQVKPGDTLLCWGKVGEGFGGRKQMSNPELERHQPGDSANFKRIQMETTKSRPEPANGMRQPPHSWANAFSPSGVNAPPPEAKREARITIRANIRPTVAVVWIQLV